MPKKKVLIRLTYDYAVEVNADPDGHPAEWEQTAYERAIRMHAIQTKYESPTYNVADRWDTIEENE